MSAPRSASVVVCTLDRPRSLARTLAALCAQEVGPDLFWEIVVVDNGASSETEDVVRAAGGATIRCVREPELGLSAARNRGWREARGEIVVFVDDDTLPVPGWLAEIVKGYASPEIAAVGGRLLPLAGSAATRPHASDWQDEYTFDLGDEPRDARRVSGANMSFRRVWLERMGGFDPRLGRTGRCLLASEEHDLCRALRRQPEGPRIVYHPRALAYHDLREAALPDRLLLKRYYCAGISGVLLDRKEPWRRRLIELALRQVRQLVWLLRVTRRLLSGRSPSLQQRARVREFAGYYRELVLGPDGACGRCAAYPLRRRKLEASSSGGAKIVAAPAAKPLPDGLASPPAASGALPGVGGAPPGSP